MNNKNWVVFVINMKKSSERLGFMTEQLNRAHIPFRIQEGIDGKAYDFSSVYDEEKSRRLNRLPLAPVEKGCALSHKLILETIIREHIPYALVTEDDVEIPDNFRTIVEKAVNDRETKKTSWEYLSFNYPTVGIKFIKLWLFLLSEQFKKNPSWKLYLKIPLFALKFIVVAIMSFFEGVRNELYKKVYPYGKPARFYRPVYLAGCYLVTESGAKKLLSIDEKIVYPADRIQNIARVTKGLKLFWQVPLLVKQRRDKLKSTMFNYSESAKKYVYSDYD